MRRNRDAGFTLAEMLIALALTAIVLSAAIETFNRATDVFSSSRRVSDTDETLRAAIALMVRDFIQTGRGIPPGGIPVPSGAGATAVKRPGPGHLTFAGSTVLPAVSPGGGLGPSVIGVTTDLVNVVYADQTLNLGQVPLASISANGERITVDASTNISGPTGVHVGDLLLFSNAIGHAVGMVTSLPGDHEIVLAPGDPLNLNQPAAAQGTILNLRQAAGTYPSTTVTRILLVSYYVDSTTDLGLPRLIRQVNAGQPLAIALGAENLQMSYDFVDEVNNPTNQKSTPPANSPNQIRKVNLFLATRSLEKSARTNDYFRNSMSTGVGLRSLSAGDR